MRICFLNQAPRHSAAYEAAKIEAQLNGYASSGTKIEIVFPDDYEGSQLYETIGSQSVLNGLPSAFGRAPATCSVSAKGSSRS